MNLNLKYLWSYSTLYNTLQITLPPFNNVGLSEINFTFKIENLWKLLKKIILTIYIQKSAT